MRWGALKHTARQYDWALVALAFCIFTLLLPLSSVLSLEGDEATEFAKAQLVAKGYRLYADIWNDQPPLHTMLLATAFSAFGPSLFTGRVIAAGFGLLAIVSIYLCARLLSGRVAGVVAALWLYTAPECLSLFHAAMLEPAAVSIGLVSLTLALIASLRMNFAVKALSGCALGLALQIKYTALMVGFAGALVLAWPETVGGSSIPLTQRLKGLGIWFGSCVIVFLVAGSLLPTVDFPTLLRSQTSSPPKEFGAVRLPLRHLVANWEFWLIVGGSLLWALKRRTLKLLVPFVLLGTSLFVHALHRPWWYYYYLHLAVPLAWLWGVLFNGLAESTKSLRARQLVARTPLRRAGGIFAALAVCWIFSGMISRYLDSILRIRNALERKDCATVQVLKRRTSQDDFVFTRDKRYTFAAGVPVPPTLCVLAAKRYWSGAISEDGIRAELLRLRTPFVLFNKHEVDYDWNAFLGRHYTKLVETELMALYRINRNPASGTNALVSPNFCEAESTVPMNIDMPVAVSHFDKKL